MTSSESPVKPDPESFPAFTTPGNNDISDTSTPFPDPTASPKEFYDYLKSLSISDLVTPWEHLLHRPIRIPSTNRYEESIVSTWTDRMDILVGRLNRVKRTHPTHNDACDVVTKICNEGVDLATAELEAQKVEMAEEAKRKAEEEAEKGRKKAQAQQEMRELHARLLELKKEGGDLNEGVVAVDVNDNEFESESDGEAVTYDPPCKACKVKRIICQGQKGKACDFCRKEHKTCTNGVIRRARKPKTVRKVVLIKEEPISPRHGAPKRKIEDVIGSDNEDDDDVSIVSSIPANAKGTKGKPSKSLGSKAQVDGVVSATRKSTRLHSAFDNAAKKARIGSRSADDHSDLFRRLAGEFSAIGKTCEEIADSFGP